MFKYENEVLMALSISLIAKVLRLRYTFLDIMIGNRKAANKIAINLLKIVTEKSVKESLQKFKIRQRNKD